jgi:hypothetical protein
MILLASANGVDDHAAVESVRVSVVPTVELEGKSDASFRPHSIRCFS